MSRGNCDRLTRVQRMHMLSAEYKRKAEIQHQKDLQRMKKIPSAASARQAWLERHKLERRHNNRRIKHKGTWTVTTDENGRVGLVYV